MRTPLKSAAVVIATLGVVAAGLVASPAVATPSTGVVINEVYGGGGNSGSTYTNDFVELVNRGESPVDLAGWSVQYHSKSQAGAWQVTALTGSIAPGARYLVAEGKGSSGTTPLPTPDATGSIAMSASDGTVALVSTADALTCADAAACQAASIDLVGYGAAALAEMKPAIGASNADSVQRTTAADTDDNAADFIAAAPTPGAENATGGGTTPPPTEGDIRIHDIQGASWVSPLNGRKVDGVPGIVTAVRNSGASRGFWMQDPDADANPVTSEGVFVYTGTAPAVSVGDAVLVSATVKDYYQVAAGDTVSTTSNLSVTELQDAAVYVVSHDNPLPTPIVLGSDTVPNTYAPNLGGGNIEKTPITPKRSALDYYESIEGMRVEVDDARVVGPSDAYGEQYITTKPHQARSYRGGTLLTGENQPPSGRLEVVPTDGSNPGVSVGDVLAGATVGPIDYSQYGGYLIAATRLGTVVAANLKPVVATKQKTNQLAVATYNVENLAPGDASEKYARLADGVVTNLASPDIVALEEVQDDNGATDDGTVAADQTLTKLTAAIRAAGGPLYDWRQIDPVNDQDGGQPGGNIRVAFLFNPTRVAFVDRGGSTVNRSTTATAVTRTHHGPDLTLSPGRIDPTSDAWQDSRKPLAGEFLFRGQKVFVIGNHFDSKLGDQSQDGRFQYPAQSSAVQRAKQATAVHDFVASLLKADKRAKVVVAGDLNDYQFSPALATLTGAAHGKRILTDLITTLPKNQQYTYDYQGVSEVLDHILVTSGVGRPQYQVVHVNAEYANQVSDHDPQVVRLTAGSAPWWPPLSRDVCTPSALALGYTDALDKLVHHGVTLGGLSSIAYDKRAHSYVAAVDNHGTDPARIWFFSSPTHPKVTRNPLVLKKADGMPYDGTTADDEGLGVLPNGDFVVSSETEPSIRIFGPDGIQKASLPVPARFGVTGHTAGGEATDNATLEGLTVSASGTEIIAAMEGALSGDVSSDGDATAHRFLIYDRMRSGGWTLSKQVEYRAEPGMRIPEVASYGRDSLLVEEASWSPTIGNAVKLYAVTDLRHAKDVSRVADLSAAPARDAVSKKLIADLVQCPTLGASAKEAQANPLMDNFEGMMVTHRGRFGTYDVSLISDDNFGANQTTRILSLAARLP